jgi:hypothetical protein
MKQIFFISLFFFGLIFLMSCKDEPIKEVVIVEITEDITSPTTWSGNTIYVIKKYDFYVDDALTIMPGAIIKFTEEAANLTIGNGGSIKANGEVNKPIIFTSFSDDSKGGDTNDDGSSSGTPGYWGMIDVSGQTANFNYCEFYYGGGGYEAVTLQYNSNANGSINNCKFQHNLGGPDSNNNFYYGCLHADGANSAFTISNTHFIDNRLPLTINATMSMDDTNSFSDNVYEGIFVSGSVNGITTWEETELAFVYTGFSLQINDGNKLNLGTGVVIKFMHGSELYLYNGTDNLSSNYSNIQEVNYTSFKDDSIGGDSNGDGNTSSPSAGDWLGIDIDPNNKSNYADWENIHYDSEPTV